MESLDTSVPVVVVCPGYHGHAIARSLGRLGIAVYGVHSDPRSPAARSRYWRRNFFWDLLASSPEDSVERLLDVARVAGSRPILIPTDDESCLLVADHAETLGQAFLMPEQPPGLARSLSNKQSLYEICTRCAIPTPRTLFPQVRSDVERAVADLSFPVMLKGIDTKALRRRTGVSMLPVNDAGTLLRGYDRLESPKNPNLMLQEYIPGGSAMVWMFNGYFDRDSSCLFGVTGKKLRQYPPHTGVTSLGVCVANEQVATRTTSFMAAIGYRGILDIGYKLDSRTREYKLLDVNPRVGTTFRLFVDSAEMDVVRALYLDLTGHKVRAGRVVEGRKWVVENFDAVSSPTYIRDGSFTFRGWLGSYMGVREAAWFAVKDMRPFLAMAWRSIRSALPGRGRGTGKVGATSAAPLNKPAAASDNAHGRAGRLSWKRPFDLILAGTLVVALSPLMAGAALLVRMDSSGPALFRQERIGRDGRHFRMLKFRSMHVDSDHAPHRELAAAWFAANDSARGYKSQPDRRVTRVGHFLRRTSLDELPQLFNVLNGEMSLVGPRPAIPYELAYYAPQYFERQKVPPGITGLWQVHRRDRLSADEMMLLDLKYVQQCSPWLDIKILVSTVPAVIADLIG